MQKNSIFLLFILVVLNGCSNNRLDGIWVSILDYHENKIVVVIENDKVLMTDFGDQKEYYVLNDYLKLVDGKYERGNIKIVYENGFERVFSAICQTYYESVFFGEKKVRILTLSDSQKSDFNIYFIMSERYPDYVTTGGPVNCKDIYEIYGYYVEE